ncbi:hypothetical protein MKI84_19385 [Ancylobacter sp. A5.8]|uniref:hypothetical protein n=1 Tax=Ancylobacter gelatini TaxID=2919920 RepID=UPI001F4ED24D|nr:hypothetical protein [Ancylobacter gelatini]MCJ8145091.1 hypothetical protein [Ancylobacter gelatini]
MHGEEIAAADMDSGTGRHHLKLHRDQPQMLDRAHSPSRTVTPVKPPQLDIALTDPGREFRMPVPTLAEWVVANSSRMDVARAAYSKRRAAA